MARNHNSRCPHMENVIQLSPPELCKLKQGCSCSECSTCGPNLWICLHRNCLHTGCSEQANDHSTEHFKQNHQHCIHMNLSSQRIWCYLCETEVFLSQRRSSLVSNDSSDASRYSERIYEKATSGLGAAGESPETSCDEDDGDRRLMDGLVGLQNISNTCYMNAALQALSNSPPLTYYFLDCGDIIETTCEMASNQRKPGLARSYHRLIKEMWCRNKRSNGFVVPKGILQGIRSVHPMFRGFQQHDTQEFLRCFMDQLHEELKEVTPPPPNILLKNSTSQIRDSDEQQQQENDDDNSPCSSPSPSQSEAEYETCDSGVSEQSSLSDEGTISKAFNNRRYSRSPSPNSSQRNKNLSLSPSSGNKSVSNCSYTTSNNTNNPSMMSAANQNSNNPSGGSNNSNNSSTSNNMNNSSKSSPKGKDKSPPKAPHRSIISDVFDGKLLSSVQCLTCDRISTREETFQDLSLPIPGKDHLAVIHQTPGMGSSPIVSQSNIGVTCTDAVYQVGQDGWLWWIWNWLKSWFWGPAVSLHDCMAAFFSADELKGDNMYSCEKCNKLRNGIKYSRVLALPEMLCIHLKRFRHDLSYSSKISSPVHFPLTGLDMRPHLHKDCTSEISTYDLTAVICHHGTVGGGHYTSFAKHELSGKWFEFDDQLVTEVTPEVVQSCQAYVLFYRKTNPQMTIIRAQAQEIADSSLPQASDIQFYVSKQWINRFYTFSEPGPIDNWAILCPHGGLPPCKAALISKLAVPLPQPLWEFLYQKFGGGPACNRLFECDTCKRAAESLTRRQKLELEMFTRYNDEFQCEQIPATIYAISMAWFRQWQLFARGLTTEEPGPINNTNVAAASDTVPIRNVRPGSDYAQLNSNLWNFFHEIYGGGPEIILRGGPSEDVQLTHKEKDFLALLEDMHADEDPNQQQQPLSLPSDPKYKDISEMYENFFRKTGKRISFEDEIDDQHAIERSNSTIDVTPNDEMNRGEMGINTSNILNGREPKYPKYEYSPDTNSTGSSPLPHDSLNKKEKRYRGGMKSSGFFGPEGKYYTSKFESDTNIPENTTITQQQHQQQHQTTISNNNSKLVINPNYPVSNNSATASTNYPKSYPILNSQNPSILKDNENMTTLATATGTTTLLSSTSFKKSDEATPLLHQNSFPTTKRIESIEQHHHHPQQQTQQRHHHHRNNSSEIKIPIETDAVSMKNSPSSVSLSPTTKKNSTKSEKSSSNNNGNHTINSGSKASGGGSAGGSGGGGSHHHQRKKLKSKSIRRAANNVMINSSDNNASDSG